MNLIFSPIEYFISLEVHTSTIIYYKISDTETSRSLYKSASQESHILRLEKRSVKDCNKIIEIYGERVQC